MEIDEDGGATLGPDEPDGLDLWELHEVLRPQRLGGRDLLLVEASCERLDRRYAEFSANLVLPRVGLLLRRIVSLLRDARTMTDRRRLCSMAGRLAGLRAWILFDLADYRAADAWYDAAIQASAEGEDAALCGWLFGARSLIPSYQHDHSGALVLIEQGLAAAGRGTDATARAWLHALQARAHAGLADYPAFRIAHRQADRLVSRTSSGEGRHGMDFVDDRLDLAYYAGTSLLLLHQPGPAAEFLHQSFDALPATHTKAQAILLLNLASASSEQGCADEAREPARHALTAANDQPIMPILRRAQDVRQQLGTTRERETAELDEQLEVFAAKLGVTAGRVTR